MIGLEPVAAVLGGVAAGSKLVQGASALVSKGAGAVATVGGAVDSAASVADHGAHAIQDIRKGNIARGGKEIVKAVDAGEAVQKRGKELRKQIERKK